MFSIKANYSAWLSVQNSVTIMFYGCETCCMSCDHPYHETMEESVLITFVDKELYKAEASGSDNLTPVRVKTRYCTSCETIIDVNNFEDGFPLARLNEIVCIEDDCGHEYDYITDRTLTLKMADDTLPLDHNIRSEVTVCENCKTIVDTEGNISHIPLLSDT